MKSLQGNGADDGGKEGSDAGGAEQTHTHTHTPSTLEGGDV